ncbi:MAG: hypothetical protein GC154_06505 [bacterium]|nr:hypothetical protein [bacterium]
MKAGYHWIMNRLGFPTRGRGAGASSSIRLTSLALAALCLAACGVVGNVGNTIKDVFKGKRKTLETIRLAYVDYEAAVRGALAGKMIGAAYGAAIELQPNVSPSDVSLPAWDAESLAGSLNAEVMLPAITFLEALQAKGFAINGPEAGDIFAHAVYPLSGADDAARRNIRAGVMPPQSGEPRMNPQAGDYDFMCAVDYIALIAPGMPQTAIRLLQPFSEIMSYGDGTYGAYFIAGLYASAPFQTDPAAAVNEAYRSLPSGSGPAEAVGAVLRHYESSPDDWTGAWRALSDRFGSNPKSASLLSGSVALSLLYGKSDFETTLYLSARCGRGDAAFCAMACGALGAIGGYDHIPESFRSAVPLIQNKPFEYTNHTFASIMEACETQAERLVQRRGGSTDQLGQRYYYIVPIEPPFAQQRRESYSGGAAAGDLDSLRAQGIQKRVQDELTQWDAGWTIENCGDGVYAGRWEDYEGRSNVFVTQPLNDDTPCRLQKRVSVPAGRPVLSVVAGASNRDDQTGWIFRILIDNQIVFEQAVIGESRQAKWQDFNLDLSSYAGRDVTIGLENAASVWDLDAAYWSKAVIQNATQ